MEPCKINYLKGLNKTKELQFTVQISWR